MTEIAKKADVNLLVYYHLIPAPRNYVSEQMYVRGVGEVFPNYYVSDDGTLVSMPAGSDEILIDTVN